MPRTVESPKLESSGKLRDSHVSHSASRPARPLQRSEPERARAPKPLPKREPASRRSDVEVEQESDSRIGQDDKLIGAERLPRKGDDEY